MRKPAYSVVADEIYNSGLRDVFGLMGECVELSHRALNRDGFALGALDAARFLAGKPPGRYSMGDLLNLGGA